jgi:hypothetical protein
MNNINKNMDNNTIIIGLVLIAIIYFYFYNVEKMTNLSFTQQSIVDNVYDFIVSHPDATFTNYIDFLTNIKNTNLDIIDNEVFVTFKLLQKKNMFSKNDIVSAMKLT